MNNENQANKLYAQREQKGMDIAKFVGNIQRVDEYSYRIKSQSSDREYDILFTEFGIVCSCPDHMYRGVKCKHCRECNSGKTRVRKDDYINWYGNENEGFLCSECYDKNTRLKKRGLE